MAGSDTNAGFKVRLNLHGTHAPQRQVFMAAIVDYLVKPDTPLAILEVGSAAGASLWTWVNAAVQFKAQAPFILCIDTWGLEPPGQYFAVAKENFDMFLENEALARRVMTVEHIRGISADVLPTLPDQRFDIVYIDGSHYYRDVATDIAEGKRLVRDGGILCGDDLEVHGDDCDVVFARAHGMTDYIKDPKSGKHFHPGVTLAVHEAFGPVSSFAGFWAMQRVGDRFEPISLAGARGVLPPFWPEQALDDIRCYFLDSKEIAALI